jgi:hypothetical protein
MLFTSLWTLLAVAYLVLAPARFPAAAHKFAIGGVEFITMVFWFAAFVAVASRWGNSWWAGRQGTFYSCGVAAIVFSAFNWYDMSSPIGDRVLTCIRLAFVATTVLAALHIRSSPRNDTAPAPNMAAV